MPGQTFRHTAPRMSVTSWSSAISSETHLRTHSEETRTHTHTHFSFWCKIGEPRLFMNQGSCWKMTLVQSCRVLHGFTRLLVSLVRCTVSMAMCFGSVTMETRYTSPFPFNRSYECMLCTVFICSIVVFHYCVCKHWYASLIRVCVCVCVCVCTDT